MSDADQVPGPDVDPASEESCGVAAPPVAEPELRVYVADDRLSVLVDGPDPHVDLTGTCSQVLAALESLELPTVPGSAAVAARLRDGCTPGETMRAVPIISGTPAEPPEDGRLEWADDFFASGFEVDADTGAVDYWARVDRRSVHTDQRLARVFPPRPGREGRDVFDQPVAVRQPESASVRLGPNVRQEEEGDGIVRVVAAVGGRLRYTDDMVTVDEVFVIRGNVNIETGHIQHAGALHVEGDVETGAHLDVDGEIVVRGMLEPCTVEGGANLVVGGGIVGNHEHSIRVAGHVQARYIHEAIIAAGGDVEVTNEINHAHIHSGGRLVATNGRVAGGLTVAHQGIWVAQAGAKGAASTELVAGVDPFLPERLAVLDERLAKLEPARRKIKNVLTRTLQRGSRLSAREKHFAEELEQRLRQVEQALQQTAEEILRARRQSKASGRQEIFILREIHAGCVVGLGDARLQVAQMVAKPRIVQLMRGHVRLMPLGDGNLPEDE